MNSLICSAMKERGITKHDSPEGVRLCLHCPFSECELDTDEYRTKDKVIERRATAILLHEQGVNALEISKRLGVSYGSVYKYIRMVKEQSLNKKGR